jgi:hypothetical protein
MMVNLSKYIYQLTKTGRVDLVFTIGFTSIPDESMPADK